MSSLFNFVENPWGALAIGSRESQKEGFNDGSALCRAMIREAKPLMPMIQLESGRATLTGDSARLRGFLEQMVVSASALARSDAPKLYGVTMSGGLANILSASAEQQFAMLPFFTGKTAIDTLSAYVTLCDWGAAQRIFSQP